MAYTAVVTKQAVSKISDNLYQASIRLVINDGTSDIFETTASAKYNSNAADLEAIKNALLAQVQVDWDKFADEQGIYKAAEFDTMVSEIQTTANAYINL